MSVPYNTQLDRLVGRYRKEVKDGEVELADVASWAIHQGLWAPPIKSQVDQLRKELSAAMRSAVFVDENGHKVRKNYCVRRKIIREDGTNYVQAVWADIDVATHPFMHDSFAQRRDGVADICYQAEIDRRHYNAFRRKGNPEIKFALDFTLDVEDRMQSTDYNPGDMDDL
jgi:hypothetical protein